MDFRLLFRGTHAFYLNHHLASIEQIQFIKVKRNLLGFFTEEKRDGEREKHTQKWQCLSLWLDSCVCMASTREQRGSLPRKKNKSKICHRQCRQTKSEYFVLVFFSSSLVWILNGRKMCVFFFCFSKSVVDWKFRVLCEQKLTSGEKKS